MTTVQGYTNGSYRIRSGWVNAVELTAAYELTGLTKAADMSFGDKWMIPLDDSNVYDAFGSLNRSLSGAGRTEGNATFKWKLGKLTQGMINYLLTDSSLFNGYQSGKFTIQTWDFSASLWRVDWAYATIDKASISAESGYRQALKRLTIDFLVKRSAPDSPDLSIDAIESDPVEVGIQLDMSITVENVGDGATFADIVVLVATPAWCDFVSSSGSGWTLEYDEGGGYTPSPAVPADVVSVRATRTASLAAGATTPVLFYSCEPTLSGSQDFVATVSTTGDGNAGNDSVTVPLTVAP